MTHTTHWRREHATAWHAWCTCGWKATETVASEAYYRKLQHDDAARDGKL